MKPPVKPSQTHPEPETLEALACREGFSLASDLLLQSIRLASDCVNVVRSIHEDSLGPYGQVVQEIKARMADLHKCEIIHEGRRMNVDAHRLARGALSMHVGRHV